MSILVALPSAQAGCGFSSSTKLEGFLNEQILKISSYEFQPNWEAKSNQLYNLYETTIVGKLSKCGPELQELQAQGKFTRILGFADQRTKQLRKEGHSAAFLLSDEDYLRAMPEVCRNLPREFRNGLPKVWETASLEERKQMAAARGWPLPPVRYSSQWVGNKPHDSFQRILFAVKEDGVLKFDVFTLPEAGSAKQEIGLEQICVVQEDGGAKLFFTQFARNNRGEDPRIRFQSPHGPKYYDMCISCHQSGMRHVTAAAGSLGEDQKQLLGAFNRMFDSFGKVEMPGVMDERFAGPQLGSTVGCTNCHAGEKNGPFQRGALYLVAERTHSFKVTGDYTMSPGLLSTKTRALLALAEKHGTQKSPRNRYYSSRGTADTSIQAQVLQELKERGLVTDSELNDAVAELTRIHQKQSEVLAKMAKDDEQILIEWLKH